MKYLSLFSGIEAATEAWKPLGWECVGVAEIEPFPSAVLAHRHPGVHNFGDITKITEEQIKSLGPIDVIVGGFPCQDLSVAGKRKGLKNEDGSNTRSGLFFVAMQIVQWARAHCGLRWLLVENVPGLLSSGGGRDFASVIGEMVGTDFDPPKSKWENTGMAIGPEGLAEWVLLDAQWFGVAQRRKRIFALCDYSVRDSGAGRRSGPVLFEPESLRGNPPPSRETGKEIAPTLAARTKGGGGLGTDFDCDGGCIPIQEPGKRTGRSTGDKSCGLGLGESGDPMFTLQAGAVHGVAHTVIRESGPGFWMEDNVAGALRAEGENRPSRPSHVIAQSIADTLKSGGAGNVPSSRGENLVGREWPAEVAPTLNAAFGDKQGLEDQHALGGGGLFVPAQDFSLPECGSHGEMRCRNGNADSDAARRFL